MCDMCSRTWCVLPVSRRHSIRVRCPSLRPALRPALLPAAFLAGKLARAAARQWVTARFGAPLLLPVPPPAAALLVFAGATLLPPPSPLPRSGGATMKRSQRVGCRCSAASIVPASPSTFPHTTAR